VKSDRILKWSKKDEFCNQKWKCDFFYSYFKKIIIYYDILDRNDLIRKMDAKTQIINPPVPGRVTSIDFFRGFTMFLLAGEATGLYGQLEKSHLGIVYFLGIQLSHHNWHGMHFWDLIQPFFMFIVGVAIPFAVANRLKKGDSTKTITYHAIKRSFLLLFLGWALYFVDAGKLVFQFQNVLAQLSVTYLVSFLIRNKSFKFQLIFTFIILLLIDLAYRFFPVEGFNHPWVRFENLGAWFNNKIEGVDKASEWATLNFVSTTAHTVWGVLCGKLLISEKSPTKKIRILLISGVSALIIGYSLDALNITPIIKKIATSSFVFASGGWAILALCFCYWLIDIKKRFISGSKMFIIVGMNSIFIYLFFSVGGAHLLNRIVAPFSSLLFSWCGESTVEIIASLGIWATMWYLCFWLYKNKLFIKL
jgi:predicted acyltransferase